MNVLKNKKSVERGRLGGLKSQEKRKKIRKELKELKPKYIELEDAKDNLKEQVELFIQRRL